MIQKVKINKVFPNQLNPRIIKKDKFEKLVKSIKEFPEMLQLRPIVVNSEMNIIGGNMRFKACQELGLKEVYIIKAENLTKEQINQFVIKDNVGFGEWDWDILANSWDTRELKDWGMDVWQGAQEDEMFNVEEDEEQQSAPKASDDNYSNFELVMVHEDKVFVLEVLNKLKSTLNLKTTAHALVVLANKYK